MDERNGESGSFTQQENDTGRTDEERQSESARAAKEARERSNRAQQLFETPYDAYLQSLQNVQKEWENEIRRHLKDQKSAELEAALEQANKNWYQVTCLPSPSFSMVQQMSANAWEAINGQSRAEEAYNAFLAELRRAFTEADLDDLTPVLLDGIANCMKAVALLCTLRAEPAGRVQ